jgi:hypothetical protein
VKAHGYVYVAEDESAIEYVGTYSTVSRPDVFDVTITDDPELREEWREALLRGERPREAVPA